MASLEEIQRPVRENLDYFNVLLKESIKSNKFYVDEMLDYLFRNQGKQMRPLLVFLTCGLHGQITEKGYASALLIELMHTASLVHDDVVDEAFQRRGNFSVNALWRSRNAVLIGDYILSKGLKYAAENKVYDILGVVSDAMEQMSRGELFQSEIAHKFNTTEAQYYEIIRCKTAALLGVCSLAGALSAASTPRQQQTMRQFGELLGLAFQIKDDILDYTRTDRMGKIACNDLKEQKMTLPLIHVAEKADNKTRKEIIGHLKRSNNGSGNHIEWLCDAVVGNGGIRYAEEQMKKYCGMAIALLDDYPDSEYKTSLIEYAGYILSREK